MIDLVFLKELFDLGLVFVFQFLISQEIVRFRVSFSKKLIDLGFLKKLLDLGLVLVRNLIALAFFLIYNNSERNLQINKNNIGLDNRLNDIGLDNRLCIFSL